MPVRKMPGARCMGILVDLAAPARTDACRALEVDSSAPSVTIYSLSLLTAAANRYAVTGENSIALSKLRKLFELRRKD